MSSKRKVASKKERSSLNGEKGGLKTFGAIAVLKASLNAVRLTRGQGTAWDPSAVRRNSTCLFSFCAISFASACSTCWLWYLACTESAHAWAAQ